MEQTPRTVAESYGRAECIREMDAILAQFRPDATFQPAGTLLRGHDEIRTFNPHSIDRLPGLEYRIIHKVSNGNEANLEWEAALIDHDGARHPLVGVNVVRVSGSMFESVCASFDQSTLCGER